MRRDEDGFSYPFLKVEVVIALQFHSDSMWRCSNAPDHSVARLLAE